MQHALRTYGLRSACCTAAMQASADCIGNALPAGLLQSAKYLGMARSSRTCPRNLICSAAASRQADQPGSFNGNLTGRELACTYDGSSHCHSVSHLRTQSDFARARHSAQTLTFAELVDTDLQPCFAPATK